MLLDKPEPEPSFNRINSGRSIPTRLMHHRMLYQFSKVSIVSIQADQSRRLISFFFVEISLSKVSIVSIQADQSRPGSESSEGEAGSEVVSIVSIQADQSRRAVLWFQLTTLILRVSIVSIQADQSRQCLSSRIDTYLSRSFNRINSGRSIPTAQ